MVGRRNLCTIFATEPFIGWVRHVNTGFTTEGTLVGICKRQHAAQTPFPPLPFAPCPQQKAGSDPRSYIPGAHWRAIRRWRALGRTARKLKVAGFKTLEAKRGGMPAAFAEAPGAAAPMLGRPSTIASSGNPAPAPARGPLPPGPAPSSFQLQSSAGGPAGGLQAHGGSGSGLPRVYQPMSGGNGSVAGSGGSGLQPSAGYVPSHWQR
jgi:hypothetical protein